MNPRYGMRLLVLLVTMSVVTGVPAYAADEDVPREYRVKAAFIQRFLEFITWVDEDQDPQEPVSIGVVGDAPIADALRDLADTPGSGRALRVCSAEELAEDGCDVIFFGATIDGVPRAEHPVWGDVHGITQKGVLTIGEDEEFHGSGGVINFFAQGDRLRFSVSGGGAGDAGLKIGSKLMRLAKIVN